MNSELIFFQETFNKTRKHFALKDSNKKLKTQPTDWQEIFANHISDERLVNRTYKELLQLNKNINDLIKNVQRT